jgi:hypothetical protein
MATTTTNFGWDIPQSTDLVKDGATAIAALGQDIDTAMVDLKGGTTGQVLAKASGTDLDFSWVAQDDSNAIQNAIVDAKGDLIGATASDTPARLAVGTNGQILTADSTEATGLKWATPAASGGMTLLSTTTLSGSTTTISSIAGGYKELQIIIKGAYVASDSGSNIRFNGDTGSNYSYNWMRTADTTYAAGSGRSTTSVTDAWAPSASANVQYQGALYMRIPLYTDTDFINYYWETWSGGDGTYTVHREGVGSYDSSAAITSISFISNGSTFSGGSVYIYGVN